MQSGALRCTLVDWRIGGLVMTGAGVLVASSLTSCGKGSTETCESLCCGVGGMARVVTVVAVMSVWLEGASTRGGCSVDGEEGSGMSEGAEL